MPFSEVFPACAVVIHHGGIGTIAQCLRAGVPSLVVPGGLDQPFNAAQVMRGKVGRWIPRRHYTMRRAEHALKALLSTPDYGKRVREIQAQILQEDGVATLCTAVEQILSRFSTRGKNLSIIQAQTLDTKLNHRSHKFGLALAPTSSQRQPRALNSC